MTATLFETQFSPKGALVYSPNENHSFRFSVNRAFQTPNYSEFFLQAPAAAPTAGPATVEGGIETYYTQVQASLPPRRACRAHAASVAALELLSLDPGAGAGQRESGRREGARVGAGLQGELSNTLYFTADLYINELENFVTDLLPGVNPAYPTFQLTDGGINVPADLTALDQRIQQLEQGGQLTPAQAAALRAPIPTASGRLRQLVAGTTISGRPGASPPCRTAAAPGALVHQRRRGDGTRDRAGRGLSVHARASGQTPPSPASTSR